MKLTTKTLLFFLAFSLLTVSCSEAPQEVTVKLAEARESVPAGKGEWLTLECDVHDVNEGPQALWFTFSGDWGSWRSPIELFEIDWFRFE